MSAEAAPRKLEREVEAIRGRMTALTSELATRRRELLDWRLQLERHGVELAVVTGGLLVLLGIGLGVAARRRDRARRPLARVRSLRRALSRAVADPESVARPAPSVGRKVLAAVASSVAGVAAKRLATRSLA